MRVILDTNIFISYLLASGRARTITDVVEGCFSDTTIEIISPRELLAELTEKVIEKKYLRTHILQEDLDELVDIITSIARIPSPLSSIPALFQDPDDDYLLAYGLVEEVDFIVTGDKALLTLGEFSGVKIVEPHSFHTFLVKRSRNEKS